MCRRSRLRFVDAVDVNALHRIRLACRDANIHVKHEGREGSMQSAVSDALSAIAIRTARPRTSGENRGRLLMTPTFHTLECLVDQGQFTVFRSYYASALSATIAPPSSTLNSNVTPISVRSSCANA